MATQARDHMICGETLNWASLSPESSMTAKTSFDQRAEPEKNRNSDEAGLGRG
jgi:hypothetical protein